MNSELNNKTRYTGATGIKNAAASKTTRITRNDQMSLVKSKDLNTLKAQVDASFKLILAAADNTTVESFIIGKLNVLKVQIDNKIALEQKKATK